MEVKFHAFLTSQLMMIGCIHAPVSLPSVKDHPLHFCLECGWYTTLSWSVRGYETALSLPRSEQGLSCTSVCVRTVYSLASYISQGVVYILYVISSKHAVLSRMLSRKLVIVSVCTPSDTSRSKLTALPAAVIHIRAKRTDLTVL
jgi:hypothetical protein